VLADHGINAKIEQNKWENIVQTITRDIKDGRPAEAICSAGNLLEAHFPIEPGDQNKLENVTLNGYPYRRKDTSLQR
jgi:putative membrane protein